MLSRGQWSIRNRRAWRSGRRRRPKQPPDLLRHDLRLKLFATHPALHQHQPPYVVKLFTELTPFGDCKLEEIGTDCGCIEPLASRTRLAKLPKG